jgi:hypothetical protein
MWLPIPDDLGTGYAYTEVRTPKIVPFPRDISRAFSWL